jgi:hypothetical protein
VLSFDDDNRMREREVLALEFYEKILAPDEEPAFASDEANLLDLSLAPEEELIERIRRHYGQTLATSDLRKSFWLLLDELNAHRQSQDSPTKE